ncbi:MAG: hypothetical protein PHI05_04215 [Bacilli bacterium]|nr:hypothetical protein [Bacilli bacterium]
MEIYLVFSKTGTWLSRLLRFVLKKKYVHVSISLDDKLNNMYSFGRVNPNNPFSGGFVIEDLREGVFKKNPESECIVYKIKVTEDQYQKMLSELEVYEKNQKILKYNFLGLVASGLNIRLKRKNRYFCTQFASILFLETGVFESQKHPEFFKPIDIIDNMNNYEEIFEGYVTDYVNNYDKMN